MTATVLEISQKAKTAALELATKSEAEKNAAILKLAELLRENAGDVLEANAKDLEKAGAGGMSKAMLERLALSDGKIEAMARGVEEVAKLPDPVGKTISSNTRPNGLRIDKVRTPIGVIGVIYESRPNVTVDCAVLCLKSGNAAILRGGSEAFNSNRELSSIISKALKESPISPDSVQMIPTCDRAALVEFLKLDRYVDCIIPRGGEGLIRFTSENSSIPIIKHYKGVCTVYVDKFADAELAERLTINAKCQRPSVCNAAENLLVHRDAAESLLPKIAEALAGKGVELRASKRAGDILGRKSISFSTASEEDFSTEYTDLIISIEIADSIDSAIGFINTYGSKHSDLIITEDAGRAEKFMNEVDSSCVYWNASTRFTDGFEFGMGAEIGISTDKLHARGPMGLEELCSYKYKIFGSGQIRT